MAIRRTMGGLAAALALFVLSSGIAGATPGGNRSPNQEAPFPVDCDGIALVLIGVPSSPDHADFTPAFVTDGGRVIVPFATDATQTITVLTDGAVFEGVTYDAGDVLFSGSQSISIGTRRPLSATCSFSGTEGATFEDDHGVPIAVELSFAGTAKVLLPGRR